MKATFTVDVMNLDQNERHSLIYAMVEAGLLVVRAEEGDLPTSKAVESVTLEADGVVSIDL